MAEADGWDHSVDVLVIGSGNGGLTASLCCDEMGAGDVLVIEKSELYGGTSSISGGGVVCSSAKSAALAALTISDKLPNSKPIILIDSIIRPAPS